MRNKRRGHIEEEVRRLTENIREDALYEGRDEFDMDIDRMVNEGLGGGQVTEDNGLITETTTDRVEADNP